MTRPAFTVLTSPIPSATERLYTQVRAIGRRVLKPGTPGLAGSPYPGHFALVRSVVEGLREIRADFNFNPSSFSALTRVVYAPANEALQSSRSHPKTHRRVSWLATSRERPLSTNLHTGSFS